MVSDCYSSRSAHTFLPFSDSKAYCYPFQKVGFNLDIMRQTACLVLTKS